MSADPQSLGERAWEHVRALAEQIGPRPAGSPAEARARAYAAGLLERWGYTVETHAVLFAPLPRFNPLYTLAGLLLVLAGWGLRAFPLLGLAMPLLFAALPQVMRWQARRRPRARQTANLLAYRASPAPAGPALVLSAHLDSARAIAFHSPLGRRLYGLTLDFVQRVAIAAALLAGLKLLGLAPPGYLLVAAGLATTLAGGWLVWVELRNQLFHTGCYSPGANDNASGAGVLLALAEYYAAHPPIPSGLAFLLTGAEETGLHGARAFAERGPAGAAPPAVLCLDMVGSGDRLRYAAKDGTLFPQPADARLNRLVHTAHPAARPLWYTHQSGDFAAFRQAGLPATGLQVTGSPAAGQAYHTSVDTLDRIEVSTLEMAAQAVMAVVARFDPLW